MAAAFAGTLGTRYDIAPPRDPEYKGMTERNNQYFESSFLPSRRFISPEDFNEQLTSWLPQANARTVRSLGGRPIDHLDPDVAAMTVLPPYPPVTGFQNRVRLARDYYVRVDGNDYSVDPRVIGRLVDVTATLTRVIVVCDGVTAADHARCRAKHQNITDPEHVTVAKGMRTEFSGEKRSREQQAKARRESQVRFLTLDEYDTLYGSSDLGRSPGGGAW